MTYIIRETCGCGATFDMRGDDTNVLSSRREWAAEHAVCRGGQPRSLPSIRDAIPEMFQGSQLYDESGRHAPQRPEVCEWP